MIIPQETENPIDDLYYGNKVSDAFNLVKNTATDTYVDSDLLKEACEQTIIILKDFIKSVEKLEEKYKKLSAKQRVMEKLNRGHEND